MGAAAAGRQRDGQGAGAGVPVAEDVGRGRPCHDRGRGPGEGRACDLRQPPLGGLEPRLSGPPDEHSPDNTGGGKHARRDAGRGGRRRSRSTERCTGGGDPAAVAALFEAEGYWRDLVAFTWNIRTMEGRRRDRRHARGAAPRDPAAPLRDHSGRGGGGRRRLPAGLDRLRDRGRARARAHPHPRRARSGRCSPRSRS